MTAKREKHTLVYERGRRREQLRCRRKLDREEEEVGTDRCIQHVTIDR